MHAVAFLVAQHSTAQHSTAQHSTAQHSTAQHSTAQQDTTWPVPQVFKHAAMCVLEHPPMIPAITPAPVFCAGSAAIDGLPISSSPSPTNPPTPSLSAGCKPARGYYRIRNRVQCKPCVGETWSSGGITPCKPCNCNAVTECTTATCDVAVGCIYYKKRDGTPCTVGGAAGSCTEGVCKGENHAW
jgi:hypothetical protein